MRVKAGSYEVGSAGVLTVKSDDQTTVLSPYAWLRIAHDNDEPPLSPVGGSRYRGRGYIYDGSVVGGLSATAPPQWGRSSTDPG